MRRVLTTVAVTAFWLIMMGSLVHREVLPYVAAGGPPTYESILGDPDRPVENTMGIYRDGRRVGEAHVTGGPLEEGGFRLENELSIDEVVPLLGQPSTLALRMTLDFDEKKNLTKAELVMDAIVRLHLVGKVEKGAILFHSVDGLMLPPLAVPYSRREIFHHALLPIAGAGNLRVGKKWRIRLMSGLTCDVGTALVEVKAFETVDILGKNFQAFRLEQRLGGPQGPAYNAWVTRDGAIIKQELPMGLVMVREGVEGD